MLIGGIINHIVSTPEKLRENMLANSDSFVTTIVEIILQGIQNIS